MSDARATTTPPETRRAPRLGPGEYIARHITRRGRFARVDPLAPRPLPAVAHWLAVAGWALLVGESWRRAWRAAPTRPTTQRG